MPSKTAVIVLFLAVNLLTTSAFYEAGSKVVKLTTSNFDSLVKNSNDVWFIEFYAPWCGHCKNLAGAWGQMASALEGVVKVGAVDMTVDGAAGAPYGIRGYPTLKFFGADKANPIDYNGGRSAEEMTTFAMEQSKQAVMDRLKKPSGGSAGGSGGQQQQQQQHHGGGGGGGGGGCGCGAGGGGGGHGGGEKRVVDDKDVVVLTDRNFEELVMKSDDMWLVEFYAPWCGHCKNLEPEWSDAATRLKGDVKVGKVDSTVETTTAAKFGIRGYPTIKMFPPGKKSEEGAQDYSGNRDASSITQWAIDQKDILRPTPKVIQITDEAVFAKLCRDHKGVCVITFIPHIYDTTAAERNTTLGLLEEVSTNFRSKPLNFLWTQAGDQFPLEESFALSSGYPAVLAISFAKSKYAYLRGAFSKANVERFVTGLMSGKEALYDLKREIKINDAAAWDGEDKKQVLEKEDYGDEEKPQAHSDEL